jgi:putative addiction module component (TIGR02574 family)
MSLAELITEALALPSHARAYLAETLLESLDHDEDFAISAAWLSEIKHRTEQLDEGLVAALPADQMFSELRVQFGQ